jgi:hypothetical protein
MRAIASGSRRRSLTPWAPCLPALNDWLEARDKALWSEIARNKLAGSAADAWAAERPAWTPLEACCGSSR